MVVYVLIEKVGLLQLPAGGGLLIYSLHVLHLIYHHHHMHFPFRKLCAMPMPASRRFVWQAAQVGLLHACVKLRINEHNQLVFENL